MKGGGKKILLPVLAAAICLPVTLGSLTGCSMKQSTERDAQPIAFTRLSEVKITDPYAVNGMEKEADYLLKLDADKLLYYFYVNAKLTPAASASYGGGWEGALIGGHTLGHYLTALSQAYANANTSAEEKEAVLARIRKITAGLKACQDNAVKAGAEEGFVWGAPAPSSNRSDPEAQFDFVEQGKANIETQAWVPWYTMHKIMAGLIDAAELAGDETAWTVAEKLGDWVANRTATWSAATQRTVLGIEYGGMNDCMYNLYRLTGEEKYAVAAHAFDEEALFAKVKSAPKNYLNGLHANTTIPKIIGALNRYVTCHGKTVDGSVVDANEYLTVAENFWQYVIDHHTYITGGNSEWEHFGQDDVLDRERTNANCETCNTYNMLKLSRTLFSVTHEKKYLDYYENTYYNAIWSSQNPDTGMTTYFQPMASGYFKVYSSEENHFWCCTGSGMESFSKLGDSIYYDGGNATYVALYLASSYVTDSVSLTQTADLENSDEATITVDAGSTVLRLRRPYWSDTFAVSLNGKKVNVSKDDDFVSVKVKEGDRVKVKMKKSLVAYGLPDRANVYGFLYGPFVLSAELGTESMSTSTTGVNVTVPARAVGGNKTYSVDEENGVPYFMSRIDEHMKKGENNRFTLACNNGTLTYSYHFRQSSQRYGIYMRFTNEEIQEEKPEYEWETQDTVQPGYGQYENDALHKMQESKTEGKTNVSGVGTYRKALAGGSFTYRMVVDRNASNRLTITLLKADNGKTLEIKSGNTVLYSKTLAYTGGEESYDVTVPVPETLTRAAQTATYEDAAGAHEAVILPVTFSGVKNAESARVCSYIHSQHAANNRIAYFVDCGDYNTATVSEGDIFGKYNSVTEQTYGADKVTGKKWGIVDEHAANIAGAAAQGVATNSTWAQENLAGDGLDKTSTNRYTKNQYENGVPRNLHYRFELENGTYTVTVFFANPWNVSQNPCVSANGEEKIKDGAVGQELTFEVTVVNGDLRLDFTSSDKCINLCYIKIVEK